MLSSFTRLNAACLAPALVAISVACGDANSPTTNGPSVIITPSTLALGRGDRVQVTARMLDGSGREIAGRPITFSSDDPHVATIGAPETPVGGPGFLIAAGPGSTTIRAVVDGVSGTARVSVVVADTSLALTQFNGSPIPALIAADSVQFDGQTEYAEVYADSGVLVLSGLLQARYNLSVRVSQYHVFRVGDTVQRELRLRFNAEADHGIVTTNADGSLAMLSEFIGPHLEHSAEMTADGYLVHYHVPGDDSVLELAYRRGSGSAAPRSRMVSPNLPNYCPCSPSR
jgi:hypothetical protein